MARTTKKSRDLRRRHQRVRQNVSGTGDCPRLAVFRSLRHIYAQLIDDNKGHTLVAVSSKSPDFPKDKSGGNIDAATVVGGLLAEKAKSQSIESVVFDRGGRKYHGRVKALAEAARKGGLKF